MTILSLLIGVMAFPSFEPPGPEQRLQAIGKLDGLPAGLARAFDPRGFEPIERPRPGDWLAEHAEAGQTFAEFERSRRNAPAKDRRKLYFLPLGEFAKDRSPPLDKLKAFAAAHFGIEVEVLPAAPLDKDSFSPRQSPTAENRQILTGAVLSFLKTRLPEDAFALLAITMVDLYPDRSWNFVFGQASLRERVGVYSFARYDPAFHGEPREEGWRRKVLERSMKVLAHETGHMFGITHCIHFRCLMNGSNHLAESDARPLHLCPVCLRKLHASAGFDPRQRYEKLLRFFRVEDLKDEAAWTEERIRCLDGQEARGAAKGTGKENGGG